MNPNKTIAIVTGVLFIVATISVLLAATFEPVLSEPDYLSKIPAIADQVSLGALLYLIAAFTSVGIAIAMYQVLKKQNPGLALGSVVLRTIEAVMYIAAVVSLLSLLTLSQEFVTAGSSDQSAFQVMGNSLLSMREHASLTGVFAFCLGAFLYYSALFQSQLIPRWLSGWGLVAIVLMLTACVLALFSNNYITGYTFLILPIAVQEMVLAVWLIIKGFNTAKLAPEIAKTEAGKALSAA